jgi:signal transduction histidine kinase
MTAVVIDNHEADLELIRRALERANEECAHIKVCTYADTTSAFANLLPAGRVVVIFDDARCGQAGLDWLPDFIRADVGPVIILTSAGDQHIADESLRNLGANYVDKSTVLKSPECLHHTIAEALRRFSLERTNRYLAHKLKEANAELSKKDEAIAELTSSTNRFVEDAAHELRAPLAVIQKFASTMSDGIGGPINEQQSDYLRAITASARDLAHRIDHCLHIGTSCVPALRVGTPRSVTGDRAHSAVDGGAAASGGHAPSYSPVHIKNYCQQ